MDIGGVNRIKPVSVAIATELRKNAAGTSEDRDADGKQNRDQNGKPAQLTPEQEEAALKALNELPSFTRSGLTASLAPAEVGTARHIVVKDATGNIVRHIPYAEMVNIYVNRKDGGEKGTLLRRSA